MENTYFTLAINPGSTSTKIALYKNREEVFKENISHPQEQIERYSNLLAQLPMRKELVLDSLKKNGFQPQELSIVMGRGGLFPPLHTGGYKINRRMLDLILNEEIPSHASNLGAVLAHEIAEAAGVDAYIYDAVSASDFPDIAKITGLKEVPRKSFYHVLNSRAAGFRYAESLDRKYDELNLIVAHLGGGITIGVHNKGKIIDSLSDDNGPFAPERAGSIPLLDIIELCYSGNYSKNEMVKKIRGMGGLRDLLGTSDGKKIAGLMEAGDKTAIKMMKAQAYQVAKGIGLLSPALKGACDAIILTGGLAYNDFLVKETTSYVKFIAPVICMPGEYEMEALMLGGLRILSGEETAHEFSA